MHIAGKVRIVGGVWRGRKLDVPAGAEVRPTADRAREALFNRLIHGFAEQGFRLPGATVADVCAGTGAMGFEALSRGAAAVTFVERNPEVVRHLEAAVSHLDAEDRTQVIRADASAPPPAARRCDLVILDPPFGEGMEGTALSALKARGWIGAGTLVVVETEAETEVATVPGLSLVDSRTYGRIKFTFLIGI